MNQFTVNAFGNSMDKRPVIFIGLLALMLTACTESSPVPGLETASTGDVLFEDTATENLQTVLPISRYTSNLGSDTSAFFINYQQANGDSVISQVVWPGSVAGSEEFLIIPIDPDQETQLSLVHNGNLFGEVSVKAMPSFSETRVPGDYSLNAMNSILFELRDQIRLLQTTFALDDVDPTILALDTAVSQFQRTIEMTHNMAVFNSAAVDPSDSTVVLDAAALDLLDRTFLTLFSGFANQSVFLDEGGSSVSPHDSITLLNFSEFAKAAKNRLKELEGIKALASLSVRDDSQNLEYGTIVNVLAVVQAAVAPAVVSNWIETNLLGEYYPVAEQYALLDASANLVGGSNFVYRNTLETLSMLSTNVKIPGL